VRRASQSSTKIFTIGYEGRRLEEFVQLLARTGVTRVLDIRALPLSRRKGFSKTPLSHALREAGIEYVHLRAAGNPYRHHKDNIERCLQLYAGHLDHHPEVLDEIEEAMKEHCVAILCVEADPLCCHRSVIADRLRAHAQRQPIDDL
jgi:uncharacterized protein (DUF488 family)